MNAYSSEFFGVPTQIPRFFFGYKFLTINKQRRQKPVPNENNTIIHEKIP